MLGSSNANIPQTAVTAPAAAQIPSVTGGESATTQDQGSTNATPILLGILIVLYAVWAFVERHERIRDAVKPQAVALNLRNILMITLTVILGMNVLKIALAKLAVWHVPGAKTLLKVVANG